MNGLSHKQARRYMLTDQDGLLSKAQRLDLQTHLSGCEACRAESDSLSTLTTRLQSEFHERWDTQDGPSKNVMINVRSQTRRIIMSNRVRFGLGTLAGLAALIVLGFGLNFVISQLRDHSNAASETTAPDTDMPVSSVNTKDRLLAFTKMEKGNFDIFTIYPDGSGLTNLTNHSTYDGNPFWSPDGKYIAFESYRSGLPQVYVMHADGSNITQITDNETAYLLPYNNIDGRTNPWSPDGSKLLFLEQNRGDGIWTLGSININGENKISIVTGKIQFNGISWSPDGKHIGFILNDSQSTDENDFVPEIYIANADGGIPWRATEFLQQDEQFSDTGYTWSPDGQAITFKTFSQKTNPQWTVYEVRLDDHSASEKYSTESFALIKWQDDIAVILDSNRVFNWLNMDRISGVLDPYENCDIPFAGSYIKHSPGGNWAIASYCPNGDHWFYWANSDGTEIKQLFDLPISSKVSKFTDEIAWSFDDKYIAFNVLSSDKTDMYIVNVADTLKDPSIQPFRMTIGNEFLHYSPVWQPATPKETVVEEITQPSSYDGLIAFEKTENGNYDIFTIYPDGSGLTNLTNNPAYDGNPTWSPDGKRIAFASNRMGGFGSQIFFMDPNGTNVTQLTFDEGDHSLPLATSSLSNLWSPDESKLLYLVLPSQFDTEWILRSIDVNNGNVTSFDTGRFDFGNISWSPDGKYVGYTKNDPQNTDENKFVPDIYIVDADGNNPREIKKLIPQDGHLYAYQWSSKEGTIIFMGYKDHPFFIEAVYEFNLRTNSLTQKSTLDSRTIDWHDDISLVMPENPDTTFIWQRPDGTSNTLNWGTACWEFNFERSLKGNFAIGAYCPDNKSGFYWANSDGSTIKNLLGPLSDDIAGNFRDISFSPDDQYITTTIATFRNTNIFIINVEESLKDPSSQPISVLIGEGDLLTIPSWQPVVSDEMIEEKEEIVEEKPIQPSTYNGLIAFTSDADDGNLDIFTMYADGSRLTNLTNNPAQDVSPSWSPDGKRIAFESDRNGYMQIFLMDANGSNITQLTDRETDHRFESSNPWSPDGSRLLSTERASGEEKWMLYSISADGQNKTLLTPTPNLYSTVSWSPYGEHIAYIILEPVGDRNMARIHVADANGNNDTNITNLLPADEDLSSWNYTWTREGNIRFIAGRVYAENGNTKFAVYEASLDGKTLIEIAKTSTPLEDWWKGTTFVRGMTGETLTWLRSDGTFSEFKPYENCQMDLQPGYFGFSRRSSTGYLLYAAGCPDGDLWLYWANPDGTDIRKLTQSPIHATDGGLNSIDWSPDGGHVTIAVNSSGITYLYILNIRETLKNPLISPEPIAIGGGSVSYNISWQPMP